MAGLRSTRFNRNDILLLSGRIPTMLIEVIENIPRRIRDHSRKRSDFAREHFVSKCVLRTTSKVFRQKKRERRKSANGKNASWTRIEAEPSSDLIGIKFFNL